MIDRLVFAYVVSSACSSKQLKNPSELGISDKAPGCSIHKTVHLEKLRRPVHQDSFAVIWWRRLTYLFYADNFVALLVGNMECKITIKFRHAHGFAAHEFTV